MEKNRLYIRTYIYMYIYIYISKRKCHFPPAPLRFINVCLGDFFDEQISKDGCSDLEG